MTTASSVDPDAVVAELLFTPEGKVDPYPRYALLHEHAPAFRSALGAVVLSRFADCQAVLRDPRFGNGDGGPQWDGISDEDLARFDSFRDRQKSMLQLNPPDHTRLRGLVTKAFTPRTVDALRPHVVELTDELLDGFGGEVDVMAALAFPLPVTVIGEMLGIPKDDRAQFQDLVRANTRLLEPSVTLDDLAKADAASKVINAYFDGLIAERRARPQADLVSELIRAEDEGDKLTEPELRATLTLLFAAGFETTTNLIGNGLLALLRHPEELQRLRDDPGLARSAVEELLRFDSPVQLDGRMAFEDVEVAGHVVAAGEQAYTLLGAANHDPTHFSDPGRLDLGRDEGPPASFGGGIHYCLGAALARMEGQVVFTRLLERFESIELLDPSPRYRDNLTLRGLDALPVGVRRA